MKTVQSIIEEAMSIALPVAVKTPGSDADFTNKLLVWLCAAIDELSAEIVELHTKVASIENKVVK